MCVNSIVLVGGDFFLNLGVVLEARHGFDPRVGLDVSNETQCLVRHLEHETGSLVESVNRTSEPAVYPAEQTETHSCCCTLPGRMIACVLVLAKVLSSGIPGCTAPSAGLVVSDGDLKDRRVVQR